MSEKKDVLILAIESSCDETAAAVVKNGREVQSLLPDSILANIAGKDFHYAPLSLLNLPISSNSPPTTGRDSQEA